MRFVLFAILILLILPALSDAHISSEPDTVILVSDIYDLKIVDDNFAVAVTRYGVSSFVLDQETSQFVFCREIPIELESSVLKVFGDLVTILDGESNIHFLDASALPDLTYLGATDLGILIADFQVAGSFLYVATYFKGIRRYSIEDRPALEFLDVDTLGIFVTKLEIFGDTLYALDEYNGLMRYDISEEGFGVFLDYLYVPRRAYDFARYELEFYMVFDSGCYMADFDQTPPAIVDCVMGLEPVERIYTSEPFLILVYNNNVQLRQRSDLDNSTFVDTRNNRTQGDLLELNGETWLVLPEEDGGATMFNLDDGGARSAATHREGAISGVLIHDDRLFVSGISMPVDVYEILEGDVNYEYTIFEDWDSTYRMIHRADTLFTVSANKNMVNIFLKHPAPNAGYYLWRAFPATAVSTRDLIYLQEEVNGQRVTLLVKDRSIEVWAMDDEDQVSRVNRWDFLSDDIHAVTTKGSMVYVEGGRYPEIRAYSFNVQFDSVFHESVGLVGDHPFKMLTVGDYIYVLQWGMIKLIDISDPQNPTQEGTPTVALPFTAYDACTYGRWLYCVGPEGIVVLDLESQPPVIVDQGGRGGISLAVGSDILAVNRGDGLHLYQIDTTDFTTWTPMDSIMPGRFLLSQNYPNPFNLATTISYSLERKADVDLSIYNLLGQKVVTLVNAAQSAGSYNIRWDGMTASGNVAASGVYFYKLTTDEFRESRKMLLIK